MIFTNMILEFSQTVFRGCNKFLGGVYRPGTTQPTGQAKPKNQLKQAEPDWGLEVIGAYSINIDGIMLTW